MWTPNANISYNLFFHKADIGIVKQSSLHAEIFTELSWYANTTEVMQHLGNV